MVVHHPFLIFVSLHMLYSVKQIQVAQSLQKTTPITFQIVMIIKDDKDSVKAKDVLDRWPIYWACQNGVTKVIEHLLKAWPESVYEKDSSGCIPLHYVTNYDVVVGLGKKWTDSVKEKDNHKPLPWHHACAWIGITKLDMNIRLYDFWHGAVSMVDDQGQIPLHFACMNHSNGHKKKWLKLFR